MGGLDPMHGAEVMAEVGDHVNAARYLAAADASDADIKRILDIAERPLPPEEPGII